MSDKLAEKVQKKMRDGWIKSAMMIEVLAVTEEAAKSSLETHVNKMEKEKNVIVYKKDFKKIIKVDNPTPNIEEAYSNIVELEAIALNLETLVHIVMTYAPSSIEIIEPESIKVDVGEAQALLNYIAELIHKFAAAGIGGVVISS